MLDDPETTNLMIEILNLTQGGGLMGINPRMNRWYNGLSENEKMRIVNRFNELMNKEGMILVGGKGTLKPDHELPHGSETAIRRRKREKKEKKIADKCKAKAVAEAYRDHLKETTVIQP